MLHSLSFEEIGALASDYNGCTPAEAFVDLVQLSCDYLMDTVYPEFNEPDVIPVYADIEIDWTAQTVLIPVRQVYKPEYLQ
jgi:hypothetical protein